MKPVEELTKDVNEFEVKFNTAVNEKHPLEMQVVALLNLINAQARLSEAMESKFTRSRNWVGAESQGMKFNTLINVSKKLSSICNNMK